MMNSINYKHLHFIKIFFVFYNLIDVYSIFAQQNSIKGRVSNSTSNAPVAYCLIQIPELNIATESDSLGNYEIPNLTPGLYNLKIEKETFKTKNIFEVKVSNLLPTILEISLEEDVNELESVEINGGLFRKTDETPLSIRTLNTNEIERYPGGNRDISRVIQSLPGVASTASFRNDIIIRGGAPNENKFYLDEIETPVINHFATQGSSGGPVGMINVNIIKSVDVISGAFPSNRFNTTSSIFDFKIKDGRNDKLFNQITIGASEFTISNEGPIGKKTTFVSSFRRSYLQNLFKIIGLPFLPTFNDYLIKTKTRFNEKNELTIISLGAYDIFKLDYSAIEKAKDPEEKELRQYIWENLPINNQWNYMVGATFKNFRKNGNLLFIISRNMLSNNSLKYKLNDESDPSNLNLRYTSQESENKYRIERIFRLKKFFFKTGLNYEFSRYYNSTFNKRVDPNNNVYIIDYKSKTFFQSFGGFVQGNTSFFNEKLSTSFGIRIDGSDFSKTALNPLNQMSPRISFSYFLSPKIALNANTGIFYQKPPYTVLGFRDTAGNLVNKTNEVKYIACRHFVTGIEYNISYSSKFTVEGFYKSYNQYPASIINQVSLANLGADFGTIGNEAVISNSKGKSYGLEFLFQQKLSKGYYGIASLTFVRSFFTNNNSDYIPSAWDNRYIVSLTGGKKIKRNWEIGCRWRWLGGQPYTPYDLELSSYKANWNIYSQAIPDYSQINNKRLAAFHQLDIRIDKKYYFRKWNFNWYIDIQNLYNFKAENAPYIILQRDSNGIPITDENNPDKYLLKQLPNTSGQILPTFGIIVEF